MVDPLLGSPVPLEVDLAPFVVLLFSVEPVDPDELFCVEEVDSS